MRLAQLSSLAGAAAEARSESQKKSERSDPSEAHLFEAVEGGRIAEIEQALDLGVNINCQNEAGQTPLAVAVVARDAFVVSRLLHRGADKTIPDNRGDTPMEICRKKGLVEILQLLEKGEK